MESSSEIEKSFNDILEKITRIEVIDKNGRSYTKHCAKDVKVSIQDEERTLKIFIEE